MKPSAEEVLRIHERHGSSDLLIRHCRIVATTIAQELAKQGKDVDVKVVFAGGMLHDIGRNRTHTVRHGLEGAQILTEEKVDEIIVQIVRRHVGAGLSAEEAKSLGLPDYDYVPRTREQIIVCFADKLVDTDKVRTFEEEVRRFKIKGHDVAKLQGLKMTVEAELGQDPERFILAKSKANR